MTTTYSLKYTGQEIDQKLEKIEKLDEFSTDLTKINTSIEDISKNLEEINSKNLEKIEENSEAIDVINTRLINYEANNETLNSQISQLETNDIQQQTSIDRIDTSIADIDSDLAQLTASIVNLTSTKTQLSVKMYGRTLGGGAGVSGAIFNVPSTAIAFTPSDSSLTTYLPSIVQIYAFLTGSDKMSGYWYPINDYYIMSRNNIYINFPESLKEFNTEKDSNGDDLYYYRDLAIFYVHNPNSH